LLSLAVFGYVMGFGLGTYSITLWLRRSGLCRSRKLRCLISRRTTVS
jgi:hypothetical protein